MMCLPHKFICAIQWKARKIRAIFSGFRLSEDSRNRNRRNLAAYKAAEGLFKPNGHATTRTKIQFHSINLFVHSGDN